jgi:phosphatidylserine synthase
MILRLNIGYDAPPYWGRVVWFLSLAYFLGAMLRLARFTAESGPEEEEHLAFKGLPSPGAAGCVASLVIFYRYISAFKAKELEWLSSILPQAAIQEIQGWVEYIPRLLPFLGLILGFTMVANRLRFPHFGSLVFQRKHSFDVFVYLIFGGIIVAIVPEVILPLIFIGYLLASPARAIARLWSAERHARAVDESGPG